MNPRMIARDQCSGGSCPAVYTLDGAPDDYVVQGKKVTYSLLTRLTGVAEDETAVLIPREVVAEALRPADTQVSPEAFEALFTGFSYTADRLETEQHYAGTARDEEWISLLRVNNRWGRAHRRVHVVTEPLTAAMVEELTAGYEGNVAAGEDIRILPVAEGEWPDGIPDYDFWLFDSSRLYLMNYEPDGTFAGATRVGDPGRIVAACQARDAALHHATPWRGYVASRPDLQRRLAQ
jgi:hypothetical protein